MSKFKFTFSVLMILILTFPIQARSQITALNLKIGKNICPITGELIGACVKNNFKEAHYLDISGDSLIYSFVYYDTLGSTQFNTLDRYSILKKDISFKKWAVQADQSYSTLCKKGYYLIFVSGKEKWPVRHASVTDEKYLPRWESSFTMSCLEKYAYDLEDRVKKKK